MSDPIFITVETTVHVPISGAWKYWTEPEHIMCWNNASDDWHTPKATNDLREGGKFTSRMEAKDGSVGFDFEGTYTEVIPQKRIAYAMSDGRTVSVTFEEQGAATHIIERFAAETENTVEMQREGWQAILNSFKAYAEKQMQ